MSASLPREYFEMLYADGADPWHFAASSYEWAKYNATLAALPAPRIGSAFEIGCSIGILDSAPGRKLRLPARGRHRRERACPGTDSLRGMQKRDVGAHAHSSGLASGPLRRNPSV